MSFKDHFCLICDRALAVSLKPRYLCCNGHDCVCSGATLDPDVCSGLCHSDLLKEREDQTNAAADANREMFGDDVEAYGLENVGYK